MRAVVHRLYIRIASRPQVRRLATSRRGSQLKTQSDQLAPKLAPETQDNESTGSELCRLRQGGNGVFRTFGVFTPRSLACCASRASQTLPSSRRVGSSNPLRQPASAKQLREIGHRARTALHGSAAATNSRAFSVWWWWRPAARWQRGARSRPSARADAAQQWSRNGIP